MSPQLESMKSGTATGTDQSQSQAGSSSSSERRRRSTDPLPEPEVRYYRKVIQIRAEDSPNVQYALAEIAAGKKPSNKIVVPGILTWDEYCKRRATWDPRRQTVGLDAEFYEGAEILLYPPVWLSRSRRLGELLRGRPRRARAIGVDPGEGDANTNWTVVDELGVIESVSKKTPNTSVIIDDTIAFGRKHRVKSKNWWLDRGGGGRQHADTLRRMGYKVNTVAFGERATAERPYTEDEKRDDREGRYAYKNRRAEMYGILSKLCDPGDQLEEAVELGSRGFAIPDFSETLRELHRQLALIPALYDGNGVLYLPPKNRKNKNSNEITMTEIVGCSPDEADGCVIAVFGMTRPDRRPVAGAW